MSGSYVVVGVDGSSESYQAARLAATEARLRHMPLRIVHAAGWPYTNGPTDSSVDADDEHEARRRTEGMLGIAQKHAIEAAPDVVTTTEVAVGTPHVALAGVAARAALLVVGRRHGAIAKLRSTSVVARVASDAPCPVLVAQGVSEPRTNVLVGIGTSESTQSALAFAMQEADLRGTGVTAIHAWRSAALTTHGLSGGRGFGNELQNNGDAARVLSEALAGWHALYPDIQVRRAVPESSAIDALVKASIYAQMVVVGIARGSGVRPSVLTHELIRRSLCPVVIVPAPAS